MIKFKKLVNSSTLCYISTPKGTKIISYFLHIIHKCSHGTTPCWNEHQSWKQTRYIPTKCLDQDLILYCLYLQQLSLLLQPKEYKPSLTINTDIKWSDIEVSTAIWISQYEPLLWLRLSAPHCGIILWPYMVFYTFHVTAQPQNSENWQTFTNKSLWWNQLWNASTLCSYQC